MTVNFKTVCRNVTRAQFIYVMYKQGWEINSSFSNFLVPLFTAHQCFASCNCTYIGCFSIMCLCSPIVVSSIEFDKPTVPRSRSRNIFV